MHGCSIPPTTSPPAWRYQIDGDAFVYIDRDTARVTTILGYPTRRLAQSADLKISNIFG